MLMQLTVLTLVNQGGKTLMIQMKSESEFSQKGYDTFDQFHDSKDYS